MQQHKMKHAEAFCLMTYKCDSCKKEEKLWNSRDGVTPFIIDCENCGGESVHINFRADKFLPNYSPCVGQRVFVDMTKETMLEIAKERFESAKGTPYEIPLKDKEEFIETFLSSFHKGTPDVVVWEGGSAVDDRYILIDLERTLGTGKVHFWKQNKHGYTTIPVDAGRFEVTDATQTCLRDFDGNTVAVKETQFDKILEKYGEI